MGELRRAIELHRSGELPEAESEYRQVIEAEPENAEAFRLFGLLLSQVGRRTEAAPMLERAVKLDEDNVSYLLDYASLLERIGSRGRCQELYAKAVALEPRNAFAQASYGLFLAQAGDVREAIPALRASVELAPEQGPYWVNFGKALRKSGQIDQSIAVFEKALELDHANAIALNCLGEAWQAKGLLDQAAECFQAAIDVNPNYGSAFGNLGISLTRLGRLEEAERALDAALRLEPGAARHYASKGALLRDSCRPEEALIAFRKALELEPDSLGKVSKYLYSLNFVPGLTEDAIVAEHVRWGAAFGPAVRAAAAPAPDSLARPITLGFLSGDFSSHSVSFFLLPLYESIDRKRFRVCSLSETDAQDRVTEKFRSLSDLWIDTRSRSASAVSDLLDFEKVDVLIDLAGHTAGSRLDILAAARTPLKLNWLGYPNRTGVRGVDGRIVDALTDPPASTEVQEGEKLVRIDECFLCYRPGSDAPAVGELPAERAGRITFASFNNAAKINKAVVDLWAQVLIAAPDSRLLLKSWQYKDARLVTRLLEVFRDLGVERERIEFRGRVKGYGDHLALYNEVDIALDTFPYNGTTTTCEALYMGVPTLALAGSRHAGRVGVSLLSHLGLPDWIARDEREYVVKAVRFASERGELAKVRSDLRRRLQSSKLGDSADFARRFERLILAELKEKGEKRAMKDWIERIEIGEEITPGSVSYEQVCAELPASLEGGRVLDASCVDGFWVVEAFKRGASVVVALPAEGFFQIGASGEVELTRREQFEWCRSRLQIEVERMQLLEGQVYNVAPEIVGEFDWIFLAVNGNRLRHLTFALDALRSVCKGRLLISMRITADGTEDAPFLSVREGPYWLPSQAGLIELLRISNFELEGITVYPDKASEAVAVLIAKPADPSS